ncbi:prepilin peptidase [Serpentinicella sp. ANB-PHB4]|uniref:A24 family peptidase n=1 Tax=Serpentinicella sp. ANB-PHB4 TaxID=3074076 RepID=UPI0028663EF0|nr:prepilin peptidase [Serpentinicella sp. ANB-PHB4]MDR5658933.1 prepilin peptidase [Serpentinicella sp. ANB-PHB4]
MINVVLILIVLICLVTDLKERKIYNSLLLPGVIFGMVLNIYELGFEGALLTLSGFVLGLILLIVPFYYNGIGGGDVKLLATIGAIKGPEFVFYTFIIMGVAGGAIALGILIYYKSLLSTSKGLLTGVKVMITSKFSVMSFNNDEKKYSFPYGVPIAIGAIVGLIILG